MSCFPTLLLHAGPRSTQVVVRLVPALVAFVLLWCLPVRLPAEDVEGEKQADRQTLQWTMESSHTALASRDADFYLRMRVNAAKVKVEGRSLRDHQS